MAALETEPHMPDRIVAIICILLIIWCLSTWSCTFKEGMQGKRETMLFQGWKQETYPPFLLSEIWKNEEGMPMYFPVLIKDEYLVMGKTTGTFYYVYKR